ncbi:RsmE family RNA methyltransferase [Paraliomyxa miuraensis]|uniref:RsmE family RNA methyltransferase n=1 Tax=Paraliomyxa miuraensis TaxID=376150 RepID=UPI002251BB69|nr:RsmE family RNA methyltransferase [Paraliomyxa miuraensis]MCX4239562.1 16S rRNA (uracil(1498)-N(3))-methyltransferase [Paraliomyxa miuraensis]
MTARVFSLPGPWEVGQRLPLSPEESHYLVRVRRTRPGETVELLDGRSARWDAVLLAVGGATATLELRGPLPAPVTMPLQLVLVVPEPRATLEALTHASELAATEVMLVEGEHSPGGLPSTERITRTLRASQRQCGRPSVPRVHGPVSLTEALEHAADRPGWVAQIPEMVPEMVGPSPDPRPDPRPEPRPDPSPLQLDPATGGRLLVGPEGGLSPAERACADAAGLVPLPLGPWVLRTPTAVSAGLARLLGGADRGPWYPAR